MTAVLRVPGPGVGETPVAEVNPAAAGDTVMGEAAPEPGELRSFFEELVGFLRDFSSAGSEPAEAKESGGLDGSCAAAQSAWLGYELGGRRTSSEPANWSPPVAAPASLGAELAAAQAVVPLSQPAGVVLAPPVRVVPAPPVVPALTPVPTMLPAPAAPAVPTTPTPTPPLAVAVAAAPATPTPPPAPVAVAAFLTTQPGPLTMPAPGALGLPVALTVAPPGEVAVITPLSIPGAVTPGLVPVATLPPLPSRPRRPQPLSAVREPVATPPEQLPASPVVPAPMRVVATTAATANQGPASTAGPKPQFRVPPYVAALSEELPAVPTGSTTRSGIPRRVRGHIVATAA